jgi:hypothetical protein
MKKLPYLVLILAVVCVLIACGSMPSTSLAGVVGAVKGGGDGSSAIAAGAATTEFQSGEVLVSNETGKMGEVAYFVGKILQAASADTKNQAQALAIGDGKKYWVNYVLNSRKASKADFVIGAPVFVLRGWNGHDDISADNYRKDSWILGNVTSTEELFKGNVEVSGEQYNIKYVRVPTDPIK